jgi:pimeloyl-ACP methyl ester carboxylesterase
VLSAATQARMMERLPGLSALTVPRVGHAPTLEEAEAQTAIDRFLLPFT